MGNDNTILHLHCDRKFIKGRRLNYNADSCRSTELVIVDKLSYFEMKGIAYGKIGYDGCDIWLVNGKWFEELFTE